MKIKDGFVVQKVGGSYLAVAVGDRAEEVNALIKMNGTGAFLWELLSKEELDNEALILAMMDEYGIDRETASRDSLAFVDKLRKSGILDE